MNNKPYKLPKNYLNFLDFQKHLEATTQIKPKPINVLGAPSIAENLSFLYNFWAQGYPVYCVRETLLDDMMATDVGENIALFDDIELDMPSYVLFFPQNKIKSPVSGGYVDYLVVYHEPLDLPEHKHMIAWGYRDSANSLTLSYKRIRKDGTVQPPTLSTINQEQEERNFQIRNLVLQSILLLQYYPEISEQMTVVPGKEKGFSSKVKHDSQYRLPRWLGKESKPRPKYSGASGTGTGSSKCIHFRRGFWRLQPYGEGRTKTKKIKIDPVWVNSPLNKI